VCLKPGPEVTPSQMPAEPILQWALAAVGVGAKLIAAKGLRSGSSPWLLGIQHGGSTHEVVLRVAGRIPPEGIATGAAALQAAEQYGLAAPRLIASDLDGQATGTAATLETALRGSSTAPGKVSTERLKEAGTAIARVHANPREPRRDLPLRARPIQVDDHAMDRRWATLYRASADSERPAIVDALSELTGWDTDRARRAMTGTYSTPLLQYADDRLRAIERPHGQLVFVHGDIWVGNMRWTGDRCVGLIDWKTAGVGDPGVDLGALRLEMALQYGPSAPQYVLDGWQREAGRPAANVSYWDAVAALNTPAELSEWSPGFDEQGKPLDGAAVTTRRDAFLRDALHRLD
jgi:aminoglycoside phosphotransferase (APT) family kinase protein